MHVYYIMIKSSQKFWVVYFRYSFIPEQCEISSEFEFLKNHSRIPNGILIKKVDEIS